MSRPQQFVSDDLNAALAKLPSVDRLLNDPDVRPLVTAHGAALVTQEVRKVIARARQRGLLGEIVDASDLAGEVKRGCQGRLQSRLRSMLNLTGTVIHTNMGRALLPNEAITRLAATMGAPLNLEYDLDTGRRGDRDSTVESLLCELTGAEAATVVNNNAAAVLLTIAALARNREVVVSRGELVEIGGAFRMPDVMSSAGATMVEVGTTNRTHLADYERAITSATAMVMKVHTSNYTVQGFTCAVGEAQLAPLTRRAGLVLATDLGSGALVDMSQWGLPKEPTPQEMLAAGCDIVTFSGDKLLGGPQAGLIVGRKDHIARIRNCPMKRALRLGKLPISALEATLQLYLRPDRLTQDLPTLRLLTRATGAIEATARALLGPLSMALAPIYRVSVQELQSQIGSGSLPIDRLPSWGLAILPAQEGRKGTGKALERLSRAMRALPRPVIGRIGEDRLLLDCRCLENPGELLALIPALREALT